MSELVVSIATDDYILKLQKWSPMGLLPDTQNRGLRMRWGFREQFSRHRLQMKPLVSDLGMHHGTCVTHVPWCMSGSLNGGGGENVPGIPGACATHNFTYLARDPWCRGRRIKSFHIYSWKKETINHPICNKIASQSFFHDDFFAQIITAPYWHFAFDFVSVLSNGHALWTSILTFIAEVFCCGLGVRKTHLLIYRHLRLICATCHVWHLMLVYELLGCCKEVRPKPMLQIHLVCTDIMPGPGGHVTKTRD